VEARAWNAPGADWDGFDAIVLRSNWDYHFDPDAFLGWLDRLERAGARIWNPPALVRWNLTKGYLLELARAGVPTVATVILEDETRAGLEAVMAARGWSRVVMKPAISASAHDTRLVSGATLDEAVGALASGAIRRPVLVQPFVEEIQTRGEWSLVFIDDEMTHAVLKRPASGEFRVQPRWGGTVETPAPPDGVRAVARAALAALPVSPLYARIDGVETAAGFQIMEVEVNEPGLFFPYAPAAALRFAEALLRRV
jgi:glutathione synthase/RimK-type ligase-like ATP-grasp enzyme